MVFDGHPPGLSPIILDFLEAEWLGAVAGLPHFVQNLEWDLQFPGGHGIGFSGLPKNHYQRLAVSMTYQGPGDCDRIADTAVSIQALAISVTFRKYYSEISVFHKSFPLRPFPAGLLDVDSAMPLPEGYVNIYRYG
jgi:hypothetical protein